MQFVVTCAAIGTPRHLETPIERFEVAAESEPQAINRAIMAAIGRWPDASGASVTDVRCTDGSPAAIPPGIMLG